MTLRLALLSSAVAVSSLAGTAFAQAPGDWSPPPQTYYYAPPAPAPVAPRVQKWSVGVSLATTELQGNAYDSQPMVFNGAQFAVRYRGWRHLELELSFGGGRQNYEDGTEGPLSMGTGMLAARYRFNPNAPWNMFLMAGVGMTKIADHDASDYEREGSERSHAAIGIGLERRWSSFAISAELRALAVGESQDEMDVYYDGYGYGYGYEEPDRGLSGGTAQIGASFYF